MTLLRLFLLLSVLCGGAVVGGKAEAACSILSLCSCSASASGVSFGNYDPLSATATDSTGTVTVACTFVGSITGSYDISFNQGMTGTYAARALTKTPSILTYNLYTTTARNQVWGDGTAGTQKVTGTLFGILANTQNFNVYGRIPAGQNVPGGVYNDTIVVTVAY
jgi:spore coat protein U-like protein